MMKKIIRNSRITGSVILFLLLSVFGITLGSLFLPLEIQIENNLWDLARSSDYFGKVYQVYDLIYIIVVFVSIIPLLCSILDIVKRRSNGLAWSLSLLVILQTAIIVYQSLYQILTTTFLTLTVVNLVLILLAFILFIVRNILLKQEHLSDPSPDITKQSSNMALGVLITNIIQIAALISLFFIPIYYFTVDGENVNHVLFDVLVGGSLNLLDTIVFIGFLILYLGGVIYFVYSLSFFFSDKKNFIVKSSKLSYYNLFVGIVYFLTGFFISFYYSSNGKASSNYSYVPVSIMGVMCLVFSVFKGHFERAANVREEKKETKHTKLETLFYSFVFTVVTFLSLFLKIIIVDNKVGEYTHNVTLTGTQLLANYSHLGAGYQVLAFYVITMLFISGLCFLWTLSCYISNYRHFNSIAKATIYVNILFMTFLGVAGLYFAVAQAINLENLKSVLEFYGQSYAETNVYTLRTDALYALVFDVALLIFIMLRRVLLDDEKIFKVADESGILASSNAAPSSEPAPIAENKEPQYSPLPLDFPPLNDQASFNPESYDQEEMKNLLENKEEEKEEKEVLPDFDPCPAFNELDQKDEMFKEDLVERETRKVENPSLNQLVNFVVNYAKNSRLHLSYTPEDIATFVSGLGACRLSILQGMSGTGKTSLPKIFAEAINGNIDIIEVESSWKDKNELLGYYNEFSLMYTPKKFTQALYKACLNKQIPTFIVLDEMNLSRIEYYFSDFLSLMENEEDKREIKLLNINLEKREEGELHPYLALEDGHTIHVPSNVWFIGTANRDESTFVISDKVYDRAHTMNFNKRAKKVRDYQDPLNPSFYSYQVIADLYKDALANGKFDCEQNEIIKQVESMLSPFNISFGNRIMNQIEAFVDIYQACFPSKDVTAEAVETILLSKVVAKLEVKTIDNKEELVKQFEALNLNRCADFVNKLNED